MHGHGLAEAPQEDFTSIVSTSSFLTPDRIVSSGWLEHAPFAFWLIHALAPRTFVELGTHMGFSYFAFCQAVSKYDLGTACYAVDTWEGDEHAGFYGQTVYSEVAACNAKYDSFSSLLRMPFDQATEYFADASIDLLHVDGRHFYDDVKADFEAWRPKMAANGIVLFHDTNVRERDFGVWRYFDELRETHAAFEFLHGNGLGVLAMGQGPKSLRALFAASGQHVDDIRTIYAQLGESVAVRWRGLQSQQHDAACKAKLLERAETAEGGLLSVESVAARLRDDGDRRKRHGFIRKQPAPLTKPQAADLALASRIEETDLFDPFYYRANNPDIVLRGMDPLIHFVRFGCAEGRKPNAFFDPAFYREQNPVVGETSNNALLHFDEEGWRNGLRPCPDFDPAFYLRQYPEVAQAKINPLRHYLHHGRSEGKKTLPGA